MMEVEEGDIIKSFLRAFPRETPPGWPPGNGAMTWEELPSALRKLRGYRDTVAAVAARKSPIIFVDHSMIKLKDKVDEFLNRHLLDDPVRAAKEIKKFRPGVNTQDQNNLHEDLRRAARQVFLLPLLAGSKLPTRAELRVATFRTYAKERYKSEAKARESFKWLQKLYVEKRIKWDRVLMSLGLEDLPRSPSGPKKRGSSNRI
jgi:hypothetical protein